MLGGNSLCIDRVLPNETKANPIRTAMSSQLGHPCKLLSAVGRRWAPAALHRVRDQVVRLRLQRAATLQIF